MRLHAKDTLSLLKAQGGTIGAEAGKLLDELAVFKRGLGTRERLHLALHESGGEAPANSRVASWLQDFKRRTVALVTTAPPAARLTAAEKEAVAATCAERPSLTPDAERVLRDFLVRQ